VRERERERARERARERTREREKVKPRKLNATFPKYPQNAFRFQRNQSFSRVIVSCRPIFSCAKVIDWSRTVNCNWK